jgi:hypothetical protein
MLQLHLWAMFLERGALSRLGLGERLNPRLMGTRPAKRSGIGLKVVTRAPSLERPITPGFNVTPHCHSLSMQCESDDLLQQRDTA